MVDLSSSEAVYALAFTAISATCCVAGGVFVLYRAGRLALLLIAKYIPKLFTKLLKQWIQYKS